MKPGKVELLHSYHVSCDTCWSRNTTNNNRGWQQAKYSASIMSVPPKKSPIIETDTSWDLSLSFTDTHTHTRPKGKCLFLSPEACGLSFSTLMAAHVLCGRNWEAMCSSTKMQRVPPLEIPRDRYVESSYQTKNESASVLSRFSSAASPSVHRS